MQRASHSALFRASRMQQAEGAEVMWLVGAARRAWPQATAERCKPDPADSGLQTVYSTTKYMGIYKGDEIICGTIVALHGMTQMY